MIDRENIFIILPFICLLFIGLVMVTSSSVYVAEKMYGNPFQFAEKHIIFLCLGMITTVVAISIPSKLFYTMIGFFCWPPSYYCWPCYCQALELRLMEVRDG